MMMRTQKYNIKVHNRPGNQIPVADTLSRRALNSTDAPDKAFDRHVHSVMSRLPISDKKLEELYRATANDEQIN